MVEQTEGMDCWIASSSAVMQALLWSVVVKKGVIKKLKLLLTIPILPKVMRYFARAKEQDTGNKLV